MEYNTNIGGLQYIDRGDPAANDFEVGDLVKSGNWENLDFSPIIPANAKIVKFRIDALYAGTGQYWDFKYSGHNNNISSYQVSIIVNGHHHPACFEIPVDSDGIVKYRMSNVVWATASVSVIGWWK